MIGKEELSEHRQFEINCLKQGKARPAGAVSSPEQLF